MSKWKTRIDLSGQRFERLIVLFYSHTENKKAYWKCKCDCGKEIITKGWYLLSGDTNSCGCYHKDRASEVNMKEPGRSGFTALYCNYRKRAIKKGLIFELSKEEFKQLTNNNCYYCNKNPSNLYYISKNKHVTAKAHKHSEYVYNGVDRIDNNKGYSMTNCVSCCKTCNTTKHSITYDLALKFIKLFEERFGKPAKEKE